MRLQGLVDAAHWVRMRVSPMIGHAKGFADARLGLRSPKQVAADDFASAPHRIYVVPEG